MDKKLLKIVLSEAVIGFGLLFWYNSSISKETYGLVAAAGIGVILFITVGIIAITLIVAFVGKLLENKNSANLELPKKRYGFKFWVIIILCMVAFIAALPYIVELVDKAIYSVEKRENCSQVITRARQPKSGEIRDFPTPCDVPTGWEKM